jgi:acyl-CoA thioester hydrolase
VTRPDHAAPAGAAVTSFRHRVAFFETDAMAIVHHANYVRWLELARIRWMDEHHRPYRAYVAEGLHFATTRVEIDYRRAAVFDDEVEVTTWLEWTRGASLRMVYRLRGPDGALLAEAATEHAMVDASGRVRRIPAAEREALARLVPRPS